MQQVSRSKYRFLLVIVLVTALGLLSFTGFYVFKRYSNILADVKNQLNPSFTLLNMERVNNSLLEAESALQNYYLTGDESFLSNYFDVSDQVKKDLTLLKEVGKDRPEVWRLAKVYAQNIESLLDLFEQQYFSREGNRVEATLAELKEQLREQNQVIDSLKDEEADTTAAEQEKKQKRSFTDWLLGKNKPENNDNTEETTSENELPQRRLTMLDSLTKRIEKLGEEENERYLAEQKKSLAISTKESQLKSENLQLIAEVEELEKKYLAAQTVFAEEEIDQTNRWIGILLILLVVLVSVSAIVVFVNLERNRAYLAALNAAKEEAENLAKTKSRFLANMSHELRTPLNAVIGFTEQLNNQELKPDQKEQLGYVDSAAKHLLEVVNEVLDYSKLNTNALHIKNQQFKLRESMASIARITEKLSQSKGLELKLVVDEKLPNVFIGDEFRLRQCLFNLLGNAIKFTDTGSVTLKVKHCDQEGEKVRLQFVVEDTGIGIKPEDVKRIFHEFEQIDHPDQQAKGTGLGLAITQRLVELMGGKIKVKSTPGFGTEISFKLWLQTGKISEVEVEEPLQNKSFGQLRVLIADDEEYNLKLLGSILNKHKLVYEAASNGDEALALAQQSKFDILLLDERMPGKSGTEVAKDLEILNPDFALLPIVFVSADSDVKRRTDNSRNHFYLSKPYKEQELLNVLSQALGSANAIAETAIEEDKGMDIQGLLNASGGDLNFVRDMLETFKGNSENTLKEMIQAYEMGDIQALGGYAHRLAPSCKHLGFDNLYELLKKAEKAADKNAWAKQKWTAHLGQLKKEVVSCKEAIDQQLDVLSNEQHAV